MAVKWTDSADKHGVAHEDALHAIVNAWHIEVEFDEPRVPGGVRPTLWIGPQRLRSAPLLEVMGEVRPPRDVVVFHVMLAREKHLARMQ